MISLEVDTKKQKIIEYLKRYAFLIVGLIIMAFGVAFSKKAALGASPISSIPFVLKPIARLDIGIATTIVNTIIVLLQIVILRKKFKWINLLQIPVCAVFGYICQFAEWCLSGIVLQTGLSAALCWQNWLTCIAGIVLVAFGVSMEVTAKVMTLAGEGLALALCQVQTKIKFRFMKVIVDVSLVTIAVALSFTCLKSLYTDSVYFGTAAAAICVGLIAGQFNKFMKPLGDKIFGQKNVKEC
ncbi:MAG: YitT family protein [Clostridia bacterium]|nr:YitT family protein [Clostridia bacterium]